MNIINKISKGDRVIWIVALLFGIISLIVVYSAASALVVRNYGGKMSTMLIKHCFTLLLGYAFLIAAYFVDYKKFSWIFSVVMWVCVPLLLYTMFFGSRLNNASRSISILGFSIQPSEWAKISLVTYIAKELVTMKEKLCEFKSVLLRIGIPILLIVGCIFTENLSTALLLLMVCIVMLIVGQVKIKYILAIGFIGVFMLGGYILIDSVATNIRNNKTEKAYAEAVANNTDTGAKVVIRKSRVQTWISRIESMFDGKDGEIDPFDNQHYQKTFAKIAVASSGFIGNGPGKSEQRNFLPHPYSDFIYAIIIEEYGIIGGLVVMLLYIIFFTRVMRIVSKWPMTFAAYMSFGLGFLLVMQAMINMGVSTTLLPVTGQPLPFISMGGTSIMATGCLIGMILSVTRSLNTEESEQTEEITENADIDERYTESCD